MLLLNRDRDQRTNERIERYRKLAAGKVSSVTSEGRDAGAVVKAEWREEIDRKFGGYENKQKMVMSPRSASVNKDIRAILKMEDVRKLKLDKMIARNQELVEMERTEAIIARRKGGGGKKDKFFP